MKAGRNNGLAGDGNPGEKRPWICTDGAITDETRRPSVQLFSFDSCAGPDSLFTPLDRARIVDLRQFSTLQRLVMAARAVDGAVIISATGPSAEYARFLSLAEEVGRLNLSQDHLRARLMVLLTDALTPAAVDALERLGVRVFPRRYSELIEEFARLLAWQLSRKQAAAPSFHVVYHDVATLTVLLRGRIEEVELLYGDRLAMLFELLALNKRWHTTQQIADDLEVSRSSVKVYLARLRTEYDVKRLIAGVDISGDKVFRSVRVNGAWMHRIFARIDLR